MMGLMKSGGTEGKRNRNIQTQRNQSYLALKIEPEILLKHNLVLLLRYLGSETWAL